MAFERSASEIRLEGTYLYANCGEHDNPGKINLNLHVGVEGGELVPNSADFADSASNYRIIDDHSDHIILVADVKTPTGGTQPSAIDLSRYIKVASDRDLWWWNEGP